MFFDESYSEHYYRKESVWDFVVNTDCLIVVGTSLETQFPERIVTHCLKKGVPVIEICLESCIRAGNNIQVKEKAETALPELVDNFIRQN